MTRDSETPVIIEGGMHIDARGVVGYVNDFDFAGVERAYTIRWQQTPVQRGWVGHQREHKWFWAMQGAVVISVVKPNCWSQPADDLPVTRFVLSEKKSQILHVPPGHAIGMVNSVKDSLLMVFSSGRIGQHQGDDYRFHINIWPILD